jgi:DNA repair ATPase RecN
MSLKRIVLRDFVIVSELELDLQNGFTVLTGETGAGKSILIDAVQLVTGARADVGMIREGASRTDVSAEFDGSPGLLQGLTQTMGLPRACCCAARWIFKARAARGSMAARPRPANCVTSANSCSTFMVNMPGKA